jgi:hypothetical protein
MKFNISDLPTAGVFMSKDQFLSYLERQKCSHCENRATWLPREKGIGYCDNHFPYNEEVKVNNELNE